MTNLEPGIIIKFHHHHHQWKFQSFKSINMVHIWTMQTKKTFHQFQLYIRYYRFYFGNVLIKSFLQPIHTSAHIHTQCQNEEEKKISKLNKKKRITASKSRWEFFLLFVWHSKAMKWAHRKSLRTKWWSP